MVAIQSFHHSKIKLQGYGGYSKLSPQQNHFSKLGRTPIRASTITPAASATGTFPRAQPILQSWNF
jgi:hypothetical protein